jgi:hypothetical protein
VFIGNLVPSITTPTFTPTIANTSTNLGCYATATDTESSSLTVYWYWFNASTIKLSGTTAVTSGVNTLITTLGAGNTTKGESWNCTVKPYDGFSFGANKTAKISVINSPPSLPTHITPTIGNTTVHDRTPNFNWSSIDIDGDDINYSINISFASTIQCGVDFSAFAVNSNYTPGYDFCLDLPINWTVRAFDGTNYTTWTSVWNFTIESYLSLNLTNASMNFGSLDISQTKDTESLVSPFILENNGNMMANIARISANSSLWIRQPINTIYFRFKADNDTTEKDSFTWSTSAVSWTNMTSVLVTNQTVIQQLDYKSANDTAEIDISVTVPLNEPPGTKKATVYIIGSSS